MQQSQRYIAARPSDTSLYVSVIHRCVCLSDTSLHVYQRCIDAGAESVMEPAQLEHWPVIAAFVKDPDGYLVELLETHGESPAVSGPEA